MNAWCGPSYRFGQGPKDKVALSVAEPAHNIEAWYNTEEPFFERELIQKLPDLFVQSKEQSQAPGVEG
ncbi:hypothetical protein EYZ11_010094 [Aspergillus tanneri]|uniref:Uncharacterized protein n=1 Tax=Aspergillus tanneri TaxID=1220188 RepID=A0A4S3J6Q8_9EURO|nr:hypothetical protein EYZ11_010094 [Aspergillus tanneri]